MVSEVQNIPCSQSRGAQPDMSFEYSKFIENGFLKVPVHMLSRDLLINIVDMLLVHMENVKDAHTGLDEAQRCGEIPKKSNEYKENRIRRCGFCRKRHKLGYLYCPAYGNRCEFSGRYNHVG